MVRSKIAAQDIAFEGHRTTVLAVYEPDEAGRYSFSRFELIEKKRRGRKPGRRPQKSIGRRRKKAAPQTA